MSQSKPHMPTVRLRPGDRVRNYILNQEGNERLEGGRLPTMRDLAIHLSVSLATVQSVYRALKNEGRIITRAGDGTYLSSSPQPASAKRRLFLNYLPRQPEGTHEHNSLKSSYYGAILQAIAHSGTRFDISILDAEAPPEEQAKALFQAGDLDAMLIFPFLPCQPLIDTCDADGIPYVTIHPANPWACSNFVTPDFFAAGCRIGEALRAGGRRHVAIFSYGDLLPSSTGWAILGGVSNGMLREGYKITLENAHFRSLEAEREAMRQWLHERRHSLPDVFLCHREQSYVRLLELLAEMKISVPEETSVISMLHGTNDGAALIGLTRLTVEFDQICEAAVEFLVRRLEKNNAPLPGEKHPVRFAGGATTTAVENQVLGLSASV